MPPVGRLWPSDDDDDDDDGLVHLAAHNLEAKQSRRRSGQRVLPGVDLINLNIKKGFVLQQSNRVLFNVSSVSHLGGEAHELRLVCQVKGSNYRVAS